jgi:hypothetical protein
MFFTNFPTSTYNFGSEASFTAFQNISTYVDIIDQVKDNLNFYEYYYIQDGDRPDTISQDFYRTPRYYWTLYLLNDNIRQQGWPLSVQEIRTKAQVDYPNKVITTNDVNDLFTHFAVGEEVVGQTSGATGIILKRELDLGQIFVRPTNSLSFRSGEIIRDNRDINFPQYVPVVSVSDEYNAVHHYEDSDGNPTDINPYTAPPALLTPITYLDRYTSTNDELRKIKIIKPSSIEQVVKVYNEALRIA